MPAILFVCTANVCRSPLAEAIFKQIVAEHPDPDAWRIESAGTWGMDGESAASGSRIVAAERGEDLSAHRARTVDRDLVNQFDLILTMEAGHKEALRLEFPEIQTYVFQLSEMVNQKFDIPDPMGQQIEKFRIIADEMERILRAGMHEIEHLARIS